MLQSQGGASAPPCTSLTAPLSVHQLQSSHEVPLVISAIITPQTEPHLRHYNNSVSLMAALRPAFTSTRFTTSIFFSTRKHCLQVRYNAFVSSHGSLSRSTGYVAFKQ
jgi:hypothetical protein